MTGPAEKSGAGEKHSGGLSQVVRWLTEERPITGGDDSGFVAGAPRRTARWTYGDPPRRPAAPEAEPDALAEVRIGPAPRCAVAGETIALSVSLINTHGGIYLGWPIRLEWSSSDASIATVNEYGIVDVLARGRVELTCECEGIHGSVLLTVVEPAVAVAVGLPVPARLKPTSQPAAQVPTVQTTADVPTAHLPTVATAARATYAAPLRPATAVARAAELPPEPPPVYRRSVERGSVRHGALASLALSRGTRRFVFRLAVGAATGTVIAVVLSRSPEEYFVVNAEPVAASPTQRTGAPVRRPSAIRAGQRSGVTVPASIATPSATRGAALGDTRAGTTLTESAGTVVAEAAGSTSRTPASAPATSPAITQPSPATASAGTPAPTVSRVVVATSPSQLIEGESVRLSAAGIDDRGDAVAGRGVTWSSENEDVAVVDPDGVVTARRPGTVTIVATSEGRSGRVTLSVGARRAAEASVPSAAAAREYSAAAAGQVMRARIEEFVTALRERNGSRVASLFNAESPSDRKNLQALLERLRRPEARLKASDAQLAALEVREMEATVDFQVPMSWMTSFGRVRNQTSTFRAVLEPGDGGWRLVAIRAIGKVD